MRTISREPWLVCAGAILCLAACSTEGGNDASVAPTDLAAPASSPGNGEVPAGGDSSAQPAPPNGALDLSPSAEAGACGELGAPCATSADCCNAGCSSITQTCGGCFPVDHACGKNSECCGASPFSTGPLCTTDHVCGFYPDGHACHVDHPEECLAGTCNAVTQRCGCGATGASCGVDGECCSGHCNGGVCACSSYLTACYPSSASQCCSGSCSSALCDKSAAGGGCNVDSDCALQLRCDAASHTCVACTANKGTCATHGDCCSNLCDAIKGTCVSCLSTGNSCTNDGECCGVCSPGASTYQCM